MYRPIDKNNNERESYMKNKRPFAVRLLLIGLAAVMTLSAAACGSGDEGKETAAGTDAGSPTAAPTDAPTEAPTEPETIDPEEAARLKEEAMKNLYESTEAKILPIGGFSTPSTELRDHNTGVEGSYKAAWQKMADAGLNYMITLEEWSSQYWVVEAAEAAHAAGIKLWYHGLGDPVRTVEFMNLILESGGADALDVIYFKDEPAFDDLDELGKDTQTVRDAVGDKGIPVISNLLPTYAPATSVSDRYRTYVHDYIEKCKPEILMFDYYPFAGGDTTPALIANNAACMLEANAAGIPMYTFVQSSGWNGITEPNQYQIRANAHINLAMGAKGICYFVACEHYPNWNYSAMLNADGKTTKLYDKVKFVNDELLAMKGVYLGYDCEGIMLVNYANADRYLPKTESESFVLSSYGVLASAAPNGSGKFLIGCFKNDEGGIGYYLVNIDNKKNSTIDLTFTSDASGSFSLWTGAGVTDMGDVTPDGTLSVTLEKGAGAFLVINK